MELYSGVNLTEGDVNDNEGEADNEGGDVPEGEEGEEGAAKKKKKKKKKKAAGRIKSRDS